MEAMLIFELSIHGLYNITLIIYFLFVCYIFLVVL
jgi:hypothetical protein